MKHRNQISKTSPQDQGEDVLKRNITTIPLSLTLHILIKIFILNLIKFTLLMFIIVFNVYTVNFNRELKT